MSEVHQVRIECPLCPRVITVTFEGTWRGDGPPPTHTVRMCPNCQVTPKGATR